MDSEFFRVFIFAKSLANVNIKLIACKTDSNDILNTYLINRKK